MAIFYFLLCSADPKSDSTKLAGKIKFKNKEISM